MELSLLDTNILLRHLGQDHPDHSPRASAYLRRVQNGEIQVRTNELVIFEAVFTLERTYKVPKAAIRAQLLPLIELPGVVLPGKRRLRQVFEVYVRENVSFVDAYHAVLIRELGLAGVVSFDHGFDRIPGLTRVEP